MSVPEIVLPIAPVVVASKVTVDEPALNVPEFDQLPATVKVEVGAAKVEVLEIVTFPSTLIVGLFEVAVTVIGCTPSPTNRLLLTVRF